MRNRGDPKTSKQVLEKSMKENIRGSLKSMGLSLEARILPLMVNWKESMGKPACESTRPYCYRRIHRQLVIKVKNNSWSQELSLQQTQLLKRLNQRAIHYEALEQLEKANIDPAHQQDRYQELKVELTQRYSKRPLIEKLSFITGSLEPTSPQEDQAAYQALLREEVLSTNSHKPLTEVNSKLLEEVAGAAGGIENKALRTSFTELMTLAKQTGIKAESTDDKPTKK